MPPKRQRDEGAASGGHGDRVVVDVGGERFTSSVSTLSSSSAYFAALFSRWDSGADAEIFLDRDADSFRVLLSCMRNKKVLLPVRDKDLFRRALLDAQFLGIEWLLEAVKDAAIDTMDDASDELVARYNASLGEEGRKLPKQAYDLDPPAKARVFDHAFGSIENAIATGILPSDEKRRGDRITQLLPCAADDTVVFFDDGEATQSRRVVCLALVEDCYSGNTVIEPIVRGRGIMLPAADPTFLTIEREDQLVTATKFLGPNVDGERDWAYAYKDEAAEELGLGEELMR